MRCEEGYRCCVCQADVEQLSESVLYLRFVIGELDPEVLHTQPECHLRCQPTLAQFITDRRFDPPVIVQGPFSKSQLDPTFVRAREAMVTAGYQRLLEIQSTGGDRVILDYPLPDALARYRTSAAASVTLPASDDDREAGSKSASEPVAGSSDGTR
jgi:hypothetical protein